MSSVKGMYIPTSALGLIFIQTIVLDEKVVQKVVRHEMTEKSVGSSFFGYKYTHDAASGWSGEQCIESQGY